MSRETETPEEARRRGARDSALMLCRELAGLDRTPTSEISAAAALDRIGKLMQRASQIVDYHDGVETPPEEQ